MLLDLWRGLPDPIKSPYVYETIHTPHLIIRYKDQVAMMKSALQQEQDVIPEVKNEREEECKEMHGQRNASSCVITRYESIQIVDDVVTRTLTNSMTCTLTKSLSHVSRVPSCSGKRSLSRVQSRTMGRAQMNEEMYDDCGRGVFVKEVSRVIEDFMDECLFEGSVPE
jgi:hypothetical protein